MVKMFYVCDRCGRIMMEDEKVGYLSCGYIESGVYADDGNNPYAHRHFCGRCMDEIREYSERRVMREAVR